jgi:hypothetical protein
MILAPSASRGDGEGERTTFELADATFRGALGSNESGEDLFMALSVQSIPDVP